METQEAIARYKAAKEAAEKMKSFYTEELDKIYPRLENGKSLVSFYRKGKVILRDELNRPIKKRDSEKFEKSRGHKKGVLVAAVDEEEPNKVVIGFSMCHPDDKFDCIDFMRVKVPDLGIFYAMNTAEKYKKSYKFMVSMIKDEPPKGVIKIPQSISDSLEKFIFRCRKFFPDKQLPEWATNFFFYKKR
jgi:hypothetical protein